MDTLQLENFKEFAGFELLDSGEGYRLERWGEVLLARPDPQIIWQKSLSEAEWEKAHAVFESGRGEDKGKWNVRNPIPKNWTINFTFQHPLLVSPIKITPSLPGSKMGTPIKGKEYCTTKFILKLSPFKHTGIFAEQAANWEWMMEKIPNFKFQISNGKPKILNLFAYTGGATMVLAKAGCQVTHVDASKPTITWAHENHAINKLPKDSVRWILDDAVKFVKREIKRGTKYDGIIMDPPAFGHSPSGGTWKFNQNLPDLLADCVQLLSPEAKFLIVNGYATNSSALALKNILEDTTKLLEGSIEAGELCLKQQNSRLLSTGIFARWSR